MKEIKNLRIKTLLLLASVCVTLGTGCLKDRILPSSDLPVSHPTIEGKECFDTGYIQETMEMAERCLARECK
ncbi:hypothetical protein KAR91_78570 [Candidatus Pacearchaeota archaeon]|nr:hypothetical protein [Candidatus Pacearchaeota archaeon]